LGVNIPKKPGVRREKLSGVGQAVHGLTCEKPPSGKTELTKKKAKNIPVGEKKRKKIFLGLSLTRFNGDRGRREASRSRS